MVCEIVASGHNLALEEFQNSIGTNVIFREMHTNTNNQSDSKARLE